MSAPSTPNRFKRQKNHDGPTPSKQKTAVGTLEIQVNLHQVDNPSRNWIKGQPTGGFTLKIGLGAEPSEAEALFDFLEAELNSARLNEPLQ